MTSNRSVLLILILLFSTSGYSTQYLLNVNSYGIYDANKVTRTTAEETITGYESESDSGILLSQTDVIYIDDLLANHYLGLNFSVNKYSNFKFKPFKNVAFKLIIKTPPLTNPKTNETKSEFEENIKWLSGVSTYRGYIFSEEWEKQPGNWSFEFYYKDQLFSKFTFIVKEGKSIDDIPEKGFVYSKVDKDPLFPGGDNEVTDFFMLNIDYPAEAVEMGYMGTIMVGMIVEKDGSLTDLHIIQGGYKPLEKEALSLIRKMPKWIPAEVDGKPVRASIGYPIRFNLR